MSDEKAELAAFFNKKKGKSSKRKKLALALAMSDTPTDGTEKDANNDLNQTVSKPKSKSVKDEGWVDEVEKKKVVFETGGKTVVDLSKADEEMPNDNTNNDNSPALPIDFEASETWGGKQGDDEADQQPAEEPEAPAPSGKYIPRARLMAQNKAPPKESDFPELGAQPEKEAEPEQDDSVPDRYIPRAKRGGGIDILEAVKAARNGDAPRPDQPRSDVYRPSRGGWGDRDRRGGGDRGGDRYGDRDRRGGGGGGDRGGRWGSDRDRGDRGGW
mmetsp:Transcript_19107/g.32915  ORF Transcript_19107/g.32915 Transcript_19107/m.32915 type:complete len:272 (+) Transcript_19107:92-907(+)|eukprot:CAMPEP_0168590292 /NCGR_PEP_ID=MMETSP0420-20121227/6486_1 /TAXON_ID=498008 /ORGANISM="Pessonella sp." /LENGTH=271 /DNA_ID=CAMNT_0008625933 /DNA_START=64 /DNA_END=879 /DNA_ORIENTATION=-